MDDDLEEEMFLMSSDTEQEFSDKKNLFYHKGSGTKPEIKRALKLFDNDKRNLSKVYQEQFVPKLRSHKCRFMIWLLKSGLLSSNVKCPNASTNPDCSENMDWVLAVGMSDCYQLRCKNCFTKESVRTSSLFYGLKCNLQSAIRLLYGWVKGVDIDHMSNMLGLDTSIVGSVYNRVANLALSCSMRLHSESRAFGGHRVIVLVDIYPYMLKYVGRFRENQMCLPILCFSAVQGIPQHYCLEPLEYWEKTDRIQLEHVRKQIVNHIFDIVRPGSTLVLPSGSVISLAQYKDVLQKRYPTIKYMNNIHHLSSQEYPIRRILNTIWKTPIQICEEAQFFNPDYVGQFLVRRLWNEIYKEESFTQLIKFIVHETKRGEINQYYDEEDL